MKKLLVTGNFSFSDSVLKRLVLQTHKKQRLVWEKVKNIGKKKKDLRKIVDKGEISPFSSLFSRQSVSKNPLIATFQLSSAVSLNLARSQTCVLGNAGKFQITCCKVCSTGYH